MYRIKELFKIIRDLYIYREHLASYLAARSAFKDKIYNPNKVFENLRNRDKMYVVDSCISFADISNRLTLNIKDFYVVEDGVGYRFKLRAFFNVIKKVESDEYIKNLQDLRIVEPKILLESYKLTRKILEDEDISKIYYDNNGDSITNLLFMFYARKKVIVVSSLFCDHKYDREITEFIDKYRDELISYYGDETPPSEYITYHSAHTLPNMLYLYGRDKFIDIFGDSCLDIDDPNILYRKNNHDMLKYISTPIEYNSIKAFYKL